MRRKYDIYVAPSGFDGDLHVSVTALDDDGWESSIDIVPRTPGKSRLAMAQIAAKRLRRLADKIVASEQNKEASDDTPKRE